MQIARGALLQRTGGRAASPEEALRRQLVWLAWIRLVLITTAFFATLVVKPDRVAAVPLVSLQAVLVLAYAASAANVGALVAVRSTALVAAIQFGGDLLVETALLHVLVPALNYDGAVAFAMATYFLTTLVACAYLSRYQGAAFATGAFLLQVGVHLLPRTAWGASLDLVIPLLPAASTQDVVRNLFLIMFTLYGTAWLQAARGERLRAMGGRLQSVTDEYHDLQAFSEHVIQSMDTGLVTTDSEGLVTSANRAARRLLGVEAQELRGRTLHDALGWTAHREADLAGPRSGLPARFGRQADLGGRRVSLDVSASPLRDKDGRPLGFLFLLDDVTELRVLEQEVLLKDKMAAIGEMAAGIAHEIRNPLASISGSVQILRGQLQLDAEREELMGIVLKESRRLDKTIRDFLDFARPRELHRRRVDLRELARETVTLLRHSEEVGEHHRLLVTGGAAVEVDADPDRLRQVTWNLCQNALKAMPDGGTMTVEVETLPGPAGMPEAVLRVSDSGTGMSADARARAFQPLAGEFRSGSGLGLAIVYRIVKDHGGRVTIDSAPGAGTRVEVRLPVRAADAGEAA